MQFTLGSQSSPNSSSQGSCEPLENPCSRLAGPLLRVNPRLPHHNLAFQCWELVAAGRGPSELWPDKMGHKFMAEPGLRGSLCGSNTLHGSPLLLFPMNLARPATSGDRWMLFHPGTYTLKDPIHPVKPHPHLINSLAWPKNLGGPHLLLPGPMGPLNSHPENRIRRWHRGPFSVLKQQVTPWTHLEEPGHPRASSILPKEPQKGKGWRKGLN